MGHQLLEDQPPEGRMLALEKPGQVRVGRGVMEIDQGLGQAREAGAGKQLARQELAGGPGRHEIQGLVDQPAQAVLEQALGGRIDGRQMLPTLGRGLPLGADAILRVDHLQAVRPLAYLAEAPQPDAGPQDLELLGGEMEEAPEQARTPGVAVAEPDLEGAPPPVGDLGVGDDPLHRRLGARTQLAQRDQTGAVLPAQGQMEEEVLDPVDAELGEPLADPGTDPLELLDRLLIEGLLVGRLLFGRLLVGRLGARARGIAGPGRAGHGARDPWPGRGVTGPRQWAPPAALGQGRGTPRSSA